MARRRNRYKKAKQRKRNARELSEQLDENLIFQEFYEKRDELFAEAVRRVTFDLEHNVQRWRIPAPGGEDGKQVFARLHAAVIEDFCTNFSRKTDFHTIARMLGEKQPSVPLFFAHQLEEGKVASDLIQQGNSPGTVRMALTSFFRDRRQTREFTWDLLDAFTPDVVAKALAKNPRYQEMVRPVQRKLDAMALLYADFRESTPDNYALFFPEARGMTREFILHLGPTNSGKTYEAVKRLEEADRGVYLAPLRLLAYEQFERVNQDGVYCSMITGEERIVVDGATHQSSTIEMWNPNSVWDVAVIDEAQMITDPDRGSAWTNAILGVRASEIHLCASPDAKDCLIRMIESCGDTYRVVTHERKTPLKIDQHAFRFPDKVEPGDALIVFTRRDVHGVAAELRRAHISCSIIYGALPYDVRHREAERFARGETSVVVATDAIGMGMNLPIRRVVFLQQEKFDGKRTRWLSSSEVKQIGGRAGRFGIYDVGYVQSFGQKRRVSELLKAELRPIEKAVIGIPADFYERDGNISDILTVWDALPATQDYDKGDIAEKIKIARDLENIAENKELVRQFIRFSVDSDDREVYSLLKAYYTEKSQGREPDLEPVFAMYEPEVYDANPENAGELETMYRVFDFLYAYTSEYGDAEMLDRILAQKRRISDKLMVILESGYVERTCRICGRRLAWSYPYGLCEECHDKQYREYLRQNKNSGSS